MERIIKYGFQPVVNLHARGQNDLKGRKLFESDHVLNVVERKNPNSPSIVTANVVAQTSIKNAYNVKIKHEEAPPHFGNELKTFLNMEFPVAWIGRGGSRNWPARTPDLTPLGYFLWGHTVYKKTITTREHLMRRITQAYN